MFSKHKLISSSLINLRFNNIKKEGVYLIKLYHILLIMGVRIKYVKYLIERYWLIIIKGNSIGWAPAQVNIMKILINIQYNIWFSGKKDKEGIIIFWRGNKYKIKIEAKRAITPPNLLGIDRRMA